MLSQRLRRASGLLELTWNVHQTAIRRVSKVLRALLDDCLVAAFGARLAALSDDEQTAAVQQLRDLRTAAYFTSVDPNTVDMLFAAPCVVLFCSKLFQNFSTQKATRIEPSLGKRSREVSDQQL
jgi:hypothetical protein